MIRVTAAVVEKNGKYLVAQRKRGSHLEYTWEFPGGKIEGDESPQECLQREILEEFNVESKVGDFLGSITHKYSDFSIELNAFQVVLLGKILDLKSHEKIQWVSESELGKIELAPADKRLLKVVF